MRMRVFGKFITFSGKVTFLLALTFAWTISDPQNPNREAASQSGFPAGDFNRDGFVNDIDALVMLSCLQGNSGTGFKISGFCEIADLDNDSKIGRSDLNLFLLKYNTAPLDPDSEYFDENDFAFVKLCMDRVNRKFIGESHLSRLCYRADTRYDGIVDEKDMTVILAKYRPSKSTRCRSDFNGDRKLDPIDFFFLKSCLTESPGKFPPCNKANPDGDSVVGGDDLGALADDFNNHEQCDVLSVGS